MRVMAAPRKYPDELRERATRMAVEARQDPGDPCRGVGPGGRSAGHQSRDAAELGDAGRDRRRVRAGTTSEEARRIAELEREVRELRRANEILKTASAFFAQAELDRRLK
jgi:transposase